jgi:hypothetical protein
MNVLKFNYGEKMKKISTVLIISLLMSLTSCMSDAIKEVEKEKDKDDARVDKGQLVLDSISPIDSGKTSEIHVSLWSDKNVTTPVEVSTEIVDQSIVDFAGTTTCSLTSAKKDCYIKIKAIAVPKMEEAQTKIRVSATGYQTKETTVNVWPSIH